MDWVGDVQWNDGYGVARGIPFSSGVPYVAWAVPPHKKIFGLQPPEMVMMVHFRTNLGLRLEGGG